MSANEIPARLVTAADQVQDALRRADTKATTLLSLVGVAMAGVIALANRDVPGPGPVLVWLSLAPIFASVVLLLLTVLPRLNRNPVPGTWLHAAQVDAVTLLAAYGETDAESAASQVCVLARRARTKYLRVAWAIGLLVAGLVTLVTAVLVTAVSS